MKGLKPYSLFLLLVITLEVFLRFYAGFCSSVLFMENENYEYIAQPNQVRQRFGNEIRYNAESMRSAPLSTNSIRILGFGDSILNGGTQTDHSELATTILCSRLSQLFSKEVQFLNISAGSWGPDNAYAYLKEHGDFNAQKIYLIVSSHDAYDNMNFKQVVGIDKSYPSEQYNFAIVELIDRYILPRLNSKSNPSQENAQPFNSGFKNFLEYSIRNEIPLVLILHAEKSELAEGDYSSGGKEIMQFANENQIPLIPDLNRGLQLEHFRDEIHLNEKGQVLLADLIFQNEMDSLD